ncbi:PKD domain-containing protein [Luteibacter sp.]|uniref:PKD domain-containing protein n=1 Tax=Luteibacter sp. TaxID=1886636 RepID=UPI0039C8C249
MAVTAANVSGDSFPGAGVAFGSSTAFPTGGTPPYSYAWTFVSGSTFTVNNAATSTATFVRTGNPPQGTSASAVYRVTVTDSASGTAFKDITVFDSRA